MRNTFPSTRTGLCERNNLITYANISSRPNEIATRTHTSYIWEAPSLTAGGKFVGAVRKVRKLESSVADYSSRAILHVEMYFGW